MKILVAIIALLNVFALSAENDGKLKIGIKKRVENCTVKSKNGDFIHVHYRYLSWDFPALLDFRYKTLLFPVTEELWKTEVNLIHL